MVNPKLAVAGFAPVGAQSSAERLRSFWLAQRRGKLGQGTTSRLTTTMPSANKSRMV
jgi:hypothetical protein